MSLSPPPPPFNSSDPSATFLSSSALDFLLIELVPLAYRVTTERDLASPSPDALHPPNGTNKSESTSGTVIVTAPDAVPPPAAATAAGTTLESPKRIDDEEQLDAVHYRLEAQGYRVGQGLVERFSRDRPRFNDTLDVIKFLCKDLWSLVFGKNIDNLKTNHRGVYVLTDNAFRPFSRMSTETGSQAVIRAQPVRQKEQFYIKPTWPVINLTVAYTNCVQFLWFPCGIIRGALAALGINATVQAEVNELPGAIFQIKTIPAKP